MIGEVVVRCGGGGVGGDSGGDGEDNGPIITESFIIYEILGNAIDDNGNGFIVPKI